MKKLISTLLFFYLTLLTSLITFGQRGYDYGDNEDYNWNKFSGEDFFKAALICAGIIILGLLIRKNSTNNFIKGVGTAIIVLGGIGAFSFLGRPILGAIQIIWQVIVGMGIFLGIIYWVYTEFINKE